MLDLFTGGQLPAFLERACYVGCLLAFSVSMVIFCHYARSRGSNDDRTDA